MKRALLIIAFIILANPLVSNVDIIPDVFAYALIVIALAKPSFYDEKAFLAQRCARNMIYVSVAKLISIYISVMTVDQTMSLLFSFLFFVLEMVFGIPFLLKFFDYSSSASMKADQIKAVNISDVSKVVLIAIFGARLLLATLPDFVLLTAHDSILSPYQSDFTEFRPALIVLALFVSLIITIPWLVFSILYIVRAFTKHEADVSRDEYERVVKHKAIQHKLKATRRALFLLGIFSIAAIEFEVDNKVILVKSIFLLAFLAIYVFLIIKKHAKFDIFFTAFSLLSVGELIFGILARKNMKEYLSDYSLDSIFKISTAETMYYAITPYVILSSILFFLAFVTMLYIIVRNAYKSTFDFAPVVYKDGDATQTLFDYKKKVIPCFAVTSGLALISSALTIAMFFIEPRIEEVVKIKIFSSFISLEIFYYVLVLSYVIKMLLVIFFIVTVNVINEMSYKKLQIAVSLD